MAELVKVAVDAMGGDNAPTEIIKGVVEAVHADERVKVFLVGQEDVVKRNSQPIPIRQSGLKSYTLPK